MVGLNPRLSSILYLKGALMRKLVLICLYPLLIRLDYATLKQTGFVAFESLFSSGLVRMLILWS